MSQNRPKIRYVYLIKIPLFSPSLPSFNYNLINSRHRNNYHHFDKHFFQNYETSFYVLPIQRKVICICRSHSENHAHLLDFNKKVFIDISMNFFDL